jgi:uncharacterized protein
MASVPDRGVRTDPAAWRLVIIALDPRCVMITLDPETGESKPEFLRQVAQAHEGMAGVCGAVLVEGMLGKGDAVQLLD